MAVCSGPLLNQALCQDLQQLWKACKEGSHAVNLLKNSSLHVSVLEGLCKSNQVKQVLLHCAAHFTPCVLRGGQMWLAGWSGGGLREIMLERCWHVLEACHHHSVEHGGILHLKSGWGGNLLRLLPMKGCCHGSMKCPAQQT